LVIRKNKYRPCLSKQALEANLKIAIPNTTPRADLACKNIEPRPSHERRPVNLEGSSKSDGRFNYSLSLLMSALFLKQNIYFY
jgi:hypothetical protein